jgi:hypothetical protein
MSYYKYAERSSESRVDWNEISKGMVDMLKEQTRLRNEKLDAAVKLQGEVTTTLSDAPMGSDTNANQRVSQFAADAQEYSLMMNKLWRSGEMSYREYMAATNNFKTNTEGYLGQAEKYAANYEKHVERMKADENGYVQGSGVEVSELARVEDFGNFSKFTPVIDAPTGSIGLVGEDGQRFASVSQLGVAVMSTYDRLDVAGLTAQAVDQLGDITRPFGGGVTVEGVLTPRDAEGNPIGELTEYEKAEDEIVGGILDTSDNAATSTLVDYSNLSYESHHLDSPDDIQAAVDDPKLVVMMPSPRNKDRFIGAVEDDVTDADFEAYLDQRGVTPEQKAKLIANRKAQKEKAFDLVRNRIRTGLDLKTTVEVTETKAPSAEVMKMQQALAEESSLLGDWMQLLYATDEERIDALEDAIAGDPTAQERGIRNIEASGDSVVITYTDERAKKEGKPQVIIPKAQLGDTEGERARSMRNWAVAGRGIHGVSTDRSDRILVDRGFITIEEGEDGTPVVVQQEEAVMDPEVSGGGPIDPIADFNTDTMGVTYTPKSGTSAGKTEVIQVPYSKVFDDEVIGQKIIDLDNASSVSRKIIEEAGRGRLDSRFITPISKDAIGEKAPELGTSEGFVWGQVGVISFYVPEAMDDVIYIPAHQNAKAKLGDLTERVLSYAKRGEKMSMEEIQNWIDSYGDDDLYDYNVSLPTVFGVGTPEQVPSRTERSVGPVPRLVPPLETDSVPRVNG